MDANDRDVPTQFALERAFDNDLNAIGRLAGIIPQPQICPVVDKEAHND